MNFSVLFFLPFLFSSSYGSLINSQKNSPLHNKEIPFRKFLFAKDHLFLQQDSDQLQSEQLPDDLNDKGDDYNQGGLYYLLATSFIDTQQDTGKLWVIPIDNLDDTYILIQGLQYPVGVCFDINFKFLYIVDRGLDDQLGYIYQYSINWDEDDKFTLKTAQYAIIFQGLDPYDCKIDQYGNMYFVQAVANKINFINYLDLYSGLTNMHYTLYENTEDDQKINTPVSLEVIQSQTIYFVNNLNGDIIGTLNSAPTNIDQTNSEDITILVQDDQKPWGVAYSEENVVFYTLNDGTVMSYDLENGEILLKTQEFDQPRGITFSEGEIYVADYAVGSIYQLNDEDGIDQPERIIEIQGCYAVFSVNSDGIYIMVTSLIFWSII